jgi:hypothetical protein
LSSIIYGKVTPNYIDFLSKIIESHGHLAILSTIDAAQGEVRILATSSTIAEVNVLLSNLPFPLEILPSPADETHEK